MDSRARKILRIAGSLPNDYTLRLKTHSQGIWASQNNDSDVVGGRVNRLRTRRALSLD
jgi:hypothetical protein